MAREATLSVSLTNRLRDYVREKVESGRYESASEVIRESLRSMQEDERRQQIYWASVRLKVKEARDAIAAGEVVEGRAFMKRTISKLASRAAGKGRGPRAPKG
jgi:antitoxin ParD1/3/4